MNRTTKRLPRRTVLAVFGCIVLVVISLLWQKPWDRTAQPPRADAAATADSRSGTRTGFPPATVDPRADLSAHSDHVEICGVGWVRKGAASDAIYEARDAAAGAALEAAAAALMAKGTPAERAAALYVRGADAWLLRMQEIAGCGPDAECARTARERAHEAVYPLSQPLLRDGLATVDAKVYALAFLACRTEGPGNSKAAECAQVSAVRWAQLDPDNAMAWLHVASDAHYQGDAAALEEALRRASKANSMSQYTSGVVALLDHAAARDLDPVARFAYTQRVSAAALAAPTPNFHALVQMCMPAATRDAHRRQLCSDLAQVFTERSSDLLTLSIGTTLGERAGWPAAKVAELRERKDAISQLGATAPVNAESCEGMQHFQTLIEGQLRDGELSFAQKRIGTTGRTTAELAREWRAAHPARPL